MKFLVIVNVFFVLNCAATMIQFKHKNPKYDLEKVTNQLNGKMDNSSKIFIGFEKNQTLVNEALSKNPKLTNRLDDKKEYSIGINDNISNGWLGAKLILSLISLGIIPFIDYQNNFELHLFNKNKLILKRKLDYGRTIVGAIGMVPFIYNLILIPFNDTDSETITLFWIRTTPKMKDDFFKDRLLIALHDLEVNLNSKPEPNAILEKWKLVFEDVPYVSKTDAISFCKNKNKRLPSRKEANEFFDTHGIIIFKEMQVWISQNNEVSVFDSENEIENAKMQTQNFPIVCLE